MLSRRRFQCDSIDSEFLHLEAEYLAALETLLQAYLKPIANAIAGEETLRFSEEQTKSRPLSRVVYRFLFRGGGGSNQSLAPHHPGHATRDEGVLLSASGGEDTGTSEHHHTNNNNNTADQENRGAEAEPLSHHLPAVHVSTEPTPQALIFIDDIQRIVQVHQALLKDVVENRKLFPSALLDHTIALRDAYTTYSQHYRLHTELIKRAKEVVDPTLLQKTFPALAESVFHRNLTEWFLYVGGGTGNGGRDVTNSELGGGEEDDEERREYESDLSLAIARASVRYEGFPLKQLAELPLKKMTSYEPLIDTWGKSVRASADSGVGGTTSTLASSMTSSSDTGVAQLRSSSDGVEVQVAMTMMIPHQPDTSSLVVAEGVEPHCGATPPKRTSSRTASQTANSLTNTVKQNLRLTCTSLNLVHSATSNFYKLLEFETLFGLADGSLYQLLNPEVGGWLRHDGPVTRWKPKNSFMSRLVGSRHSTTEPATPSSATTEYKPKDAYLLLFDKFLVFIEFKTRAPHKSLEDLPPRDRCKMVLRIPLDYAALESVNEIAKYPTLMKQTGQKNGFVLTVRKHLVHGELLLPKSQTPTTSFFSSTSGSPQSPQSTFLTPGMPPPAPARATRSASLMIHTSLLEESISSFQRAAKGGEGSPPMSQGEGGMLDALLQSDTTTTRASASGSPPVTPQHASAAYGDVPPEYSQLVLCWAQLWDSDFWRDMLLKALIGYEA